MKIFILISLILSSANTLQANDRGYFNSKDRLEKLVESRPTVLACQLYTASNNTKLLPISGTKFELNLEFSDNQAHVEIEKADVSDWFVTTYFSLSDTMDRYISVKFSAYKRDLSNISDESKYVYKDILVNEKVNFEYRTYLRAVSHIRSTFEGELDSAPGGFGRWEESFYATSTSSPIKGYELTGLLKVESEDKNSEFSTKTRTLYHIDTNHLKESGWETRLETSEDYNTNLFAAQYEDFAFVVESSSNDRRPVKLNSIKLRCQHNGEDEKI